ncbi:MAG: carboxymuconolactone decarboxylase family protein [Lachnospiraceae bacterium]|nr:carboxymuconolactone decarboxylase family protein [Lachnospiraceae bacterium]
MAKALNPRDIYNDFVDGVGILSQSNPDFMAKFIDIDSSCGGEVLSPKTKELIGVAIGLYNRCQYCICVHTRGAYQAGATREEILAAAEVAIAFGGGPSVAYSAGLLTAALDEFEHDFD